jgi:hypothetical protein
MNVAGNPKPLRALLALGVACLLVCMTSTFDGIAAAAPPLVSAEAATEVSSATVRAHGRVTPGTEEAFYRFEYIADTQFDRNQREGDDPFAGAAADGFGWLPAGAEQTAVEPVLGEAGGLEPETEYHLRLVAENDEGAQIAVAPNFTTQTLLDPIPCFGDSCQVLPPEPRDPPLGTTVAGPGNPKVHYTRYGRKAKHRKHEHRKHQHHKRRHGHRR